MGGKCNGAAVAVRGPLPAPTPRALAPGRILWLMRASLVLVLAVALAACRPERRAGGPPRGEFLVATDDSTFWVTSGPAGVHARGLPIQLARFDGRFYEVYAMDDDRSFDDALLVGQRLYRRDLETDDSVVVFADTTVPRVARDYARANPDARPLAPDEDGAEDPSTVATADIDVVDVHGPYLSFQYATDLQLPSGDSWHSVRHGVVDLRAGRPVGLRQLFGQAVARRIVGNGRGAFDSITDSVRLASGVGARRAARALRHFRFDETSFTLTSVAGEPAVDFVAPGLATSPDMLPLPLPPINAAGVRWWKDVRPTLPVADDGRVARWRGHGYDVVTRGDTSDTTSRLVITDTARREWSVTTLSSPARRIFWLDAPAITPAQRHALEGAFEEASLYDDDVRAVARRTPPPSPLRLRVRLVAASIPAQ